MAFLTSTNAATSAEISGSEILSAFAFQAGVTPPVETGGAWTSELTAANANGKGSYYKSIWDAGEIDLIKIISGAVNFTDVSVSQSGSDTLGIFNDVTVTLSGINASDITAADFLFA